MSARIDTAPENYLSWPRNADDVEKPILRSLLTGADTLDITKS
jgi:hypothetical protein